MAAKSWNRPTDARRPSSTSSSLLLLGRQREDVSTDPGTTTVVQLPAPPPGTSWEELGPDGVTLTTFSSLSLQNGQGAILEAVSSGSAPLVAPSALTPYSATPGAGTRSPAAVPSTKRNSAGLLSRRGSAAAAVMVGGVGSSGPSARPGLLETVYAAAGSYNGFWSFSAVAGTPVPAVRGLTPSPSLPQAAVDSLMAGAVSFDQMTGSRDSLDPVALRHAAVYLETWFPDGMDWPDPGSFVVNPDAATASGTDPWGSA
jgi:hypothetical protein